MFFDEQNTHLFLIYYAFFYEQNWFDSHLLWFFLHFLLRMEQV